MNTLIIGGTGLISSAITRFLLDRGDSLTLYNRGVSDVPIPAGARIIRGDRREHAVFEAQVAALGRFDCVIDMVGYEPADAHSLIRAFRGQVGQLIFCSTVDVYRKPASRYPVIEDEGYGGLNRYSSNKVIIEQALLQAQQRGDFPLTIIRPAATYGEGRGPVHTFGSKTTYLDRIRKGRPIVVHGDGSSFWVACYRDDVARAFVHAIGNPLALGRSYHVAGEEWMTWNVYHQRVASAMGAPPPTLIHIPTEVLGSVAPKRAAIAVENFQFSNIFDNSAARADLNFRYTVSWVEGVQRMVSWLDAHGRIESCDDDPFDDRLIAWWQGAIAVSRADLE